VSFLDFLLAGDTTGELQAQVDADKADLAAGLTWGVFDGDDLVGSHPARYLAEFDRADCADANDRPASSYTIRVVKHAEAAA
jgi:hypothetical protein